MNRQHAGFTLLELMISLSLLTVIGLLSFACLRSASVTIATSDARGTTLTNIHQVLWSMTTELETAATEDSVELNSALTQVIVTPNGNAVTFQIPVNTQDGTWSQPIRYSLVNEDDNDNGLLDPGEDSNGDNVLTRRIERTNLTTGDTVVLGSANEISDLRFSINDDGDVLTIMVESNSTIAGTRAQNKETEEIEVQRATAGITRRVYILN